MQIIKAFYFILSCVLIYMIYGVYNISIENWTDASSFTDYAIAIRNSLIGLLVGHLLLGFILFCYYMIITIGTTRKKSFMVFLSAYFSSSTLMLSFIHFYNPNYKNSLDLKMITTKNNIKDLFADKERIEQIKDGIAEFKKIDKKEIITLVVKNIPEVIVGIIEIMGIIFVGFVFLLLNLVIENKPIVENFIAGFGAMFLIYASLKDNKISIKIGYSLIGIILMLSALMISMMRSYDVSLSFIINKFI